MAQVTGTKVGVECQVTLVLTEAEVRALDGMFGYDVDHFLKCFYDKCGAAYVKPYEAGVRSLHATIRGQLSKPLRIISQARTAMTEALSKPQ